MADFGGTHSYVFMGEEGSPNCSLDLHLRGPHRIRIEFKSREELRAWMSQKAAILKQLQAALLGRLEQFPEAPEPITVTMFGEIIPYDGPWGPDAFGSGEIGTVEP